tara:strand:- start:696 stop:2426 length:1731 start_codon:yes stop_codon:yes gene_type:complete
MTVIVHSRFLLQNAPSLKEKNSNTPVQKKLYSSFIKDIKQDNIEDVLVRPSNNQVYYIETDGSFNYSTYYDTNIFWKTLFESDINFDIDLTKTTSTSDVFSFFLTIILFGSLIRVLSSQFVNSGNSNPFIQNKKIDIETNISTRFNDVQGIDEAKDELEEIVDFLKHPDKYSKSGAKIPKGALLIGNPGTGKTLLARAIAGESSVPFIQVSASSFIEMFVGLGAKRVRDIFENAKKVQPCIIFIDEIDAIGKKRSSNGMVSNDEREQTVNQLLTEMDGFSKSQIVVIGATNRADILDDALLRPGRFDRKIQVKLPDINGREKILKIHSQNKNLNKDVSLRRIAKQTIGFSGADLENLINECAIRAAKETDDCVITPDIIENTYQRIVIGAKGNIIMSTDTKKRIAYHEAGHAIVGALMNDYEKVRKVSIVPRGNAGGITFFQPENDELKMYTKEYMLSQIKVALAGHAAEEIIYSENNISTGASNDFAQVYTIAREMVISYGFGKSIGKINIKGKQVSQETLFNIDEEVNEIVTSCYNQTINMLENYRVQLNFLAFKLLEEEIVDGKYVYSLFNKE